MGLVDQMQNVKELGHFINTNKKDLFFLIVKVFKNLASSDTYLSI